jgi:hypothetical protein
MGSFESVVKSVLTTGRNHANEICRLDNLIFEGVGDPNLARHITQKCGRAIVEGRISEGTVFGCVAGARRARSPGAYFVAAIKRQFAASRLDWETEKWDNA